MQTESARKKKIFIQANCQSHAIKNIFLTLERLEEKYDILPVKPVHLWKEEDKEEIFNKIHEADIFLHQPIFEVNFSIFASDNLVKYLKEDAQVVSFPNLYFTGYHPQAIYLKNNDGKKVDGPFDYHDKNIVDAYKNGQSVEDVKKMFLDDRFYSSEQIEKNLEQSLKDLEGREKFTSIKMSPIIHNRMKGKKLFHIFNHPTNEMIFILVNKILEKLQEEPLVYQEMQRFPNEMLGQIQFPVYKSVQKYLGIDEEVKLVFSGKEYSLDKMNRMYYNFYQTLSFFKKSKSNQIKDSILSNLYTNKNVFYSDYTLDIQNLDVPKHPRLNISNKMFFTKVKVNKFCNKYVIFEKNKKIYDNIDLFKDKPITRLGNVLDLFTPGATVYTHFIFDLLPKIKCVIDAGYSLDSFDYIIMNSKNQNFQKQAIELLKLDISKIVSMAKLQDKICQVDLLIDVSPVRKNYATPPWIIKYIKDIFYKQEPNKALGEKIYISRANASRRKVLNEDEVSLLLISNGFNVLYAENYTISEMNYIMARAKIIVATHGAGLANIAFCKPFTKIIELFGQHISPEYYYFTETLNLEYIPIACRDKNGLLFNDLVLDYKNNFFDINGADMYVDIEELKKHIKK